MNFNVKFKNPFKRLGNATGVDSGVKKKTFIKTDKQIYTIIGIAFAVSAVALLCYWLLKERPYNDKLLAEKDELIKTLKFTRDKLKKIHENTVASYEERLKNEYIPKSIYDDKINDYEQKLTSYKDKYISKEEHEKQVAELEQRLKEESLSEEGTSKKDFEQKITALEQKVSILEDKNLDLKETLEKSAEFIKGEKDALETMLLLERKKALIPSLVLPETKNNALTADALKKLVDIKEKLKNIEEMNLPLKSETYFGMGLVSYYNKQLDEAIEQWENAVSLNKNNLKAYICLGIVYNEENMSDNAMKILKHALDINPKYATIHLTLARIYEQKGVLDDAIYEYLKVLEINPETVDIHNKLGILYEKKGLKEEAKKSFAQYEKLKGGK
ncbi:MAG TPA: tetratricopeptide repeat protein [Candidatus Wunengus sp. YC64]|uniref:tetratricopeptide repeat protein n=2 Tax=unclassified Candidatus Wunengus TaxID=3367695 RepID=UPI004028B150